MTSLALDISFGRWSRLVVVALLPVALTERVGHADYPGAEAIQTAASASNDSLQTQQASLTKENVQLERLMALRARGNATWREVAQQRVIVKSYEAERQAAAEFSAFAAKLRERAEKAEQEQGREWPIACWERPPWLSATWQTTPWHEIRTCRIGSNVGDTCDLNLRHATLHLAATQALARGELRAAEIAWRREQLRLSAIEQLQARGFASRAELEVARQNVQAAESLVERLTSERANRIQSYSELVESAGESNLSPCEAESNGDDLRPEALPRRFFSHANGIRQLLELRQQSCLAAAHGEMIASQLELLEELLRRLCESRRGSASREREIEFTRLDLEHAEAQQQTASERTKILRLEEIRVLVWYMELPRADGLPNALASETFAPTWPALRVNYWLPIQAEQRIPRSLSKIPLPTTPGI